ncbi:MAG: hypothetical protein CSA54_04120 [Gammaproteobacteria bacterium]|nr:MAG: hypothetical protein CSA54_04120 [Gammaproteobacteria bacterium]
MSLLEIVSTMRDKQTFQSGRKLDSPPRMFLGAAANPFVDPLDWRPIRLAKKIAAGAQFVQTQYCFDITRLDAYMQRVRDMGLDRKVFILVGVGTLASAKTADWMRRNVPGVHIPDEIIKRLAGAENQKAEGVRICIDMINQVREIEGVDGVHIMAYRQEHSVPEIVERTGILGDRQAWHPRQYEGDRNVQQHLDRIQ